MVVKILKIGKDEDKDHFIYRVYEHRRLIGGLTDDEYGEICRRELHEGFDESAYRKKYQSFIKMFHAVKDDYYDENVIAMLNEKEVDVYKATQRNRDLVSKYKQLQREQARNEEFLYVIDKSFERKLAEGGVIVPKVVKPKKSKHKIIVSFADPHYGADFAIEGLLNDILNEYNPVIFRKRMWELKDEIYAFAKLMNTNEIHMIDLGDSIEGKLHISQLQGLKTDIVDDIIDYAEFICEWLGSFSEDFVIDFYTSTGNHSDLRILTGKKGDFAHENLEKIYHRWVKKHAEVNPNITLHDNVRGINYFSVNGFNILTVHGQNDGNIQNIIDNYQNTYGIKINYVLIGHLHKKEESEVSIGKQVIRVRSVMGINDFSVDIKKTSSPGAIMFTIDEHIGRKLTNDVVF